MASVMAYMNDFEVGLCLKINRLSHRAAVREVFATVSKLGDGGFWLIMAMLIFAKQGTQVLPSLLVVGLTALAGIWLYKFLKNRLVRERPYILHGDIQLGAAPLDRYSFPSGHTLHAASFTILFSGIEPALLPLMLPFAFLVAASRVILGLHYPSDVLVGAAIGTGLAIAGLQLI